MDRRKFIGGLLLAPVAAMAAGGDIVIRNAKILTVTKGSLDGSILIRNGKIAEVGPNVTAPAGARVIDAGGQFVMPGIIDCHSHIATEAVNEGSVSVSSMTGIEDTVNPEDIGIYRALAGGVTTANILHGSANAIGGKGCARRFQNHRWIRLLRIYCGSLFKCECGFDCSSSTI